MTSALMYVLMGTLLILKELPAFWKLLKLLVPVLQSLIFSLLLL